MVVPYGFSVGDVVAVGTIAWNVYKSCRAAPESFSNISLEVLSLHAVLKEAEETVFKSPLPPKSQKRLITVGDGCRSVLGDLQELVDRYESLGIQSKRTWDRMKWGAQNISEIRQRLISNTTMLTAFISTSQPSVEQKLDKLLQDFRDGRREPSVVSLQTVDSLAPNDKEIWRSIRKELEDIGITIAAFDANKDFIFSWFTNAVESGSFQEERPPSPSESICSSGIHSPITSSSSFKVDVLDARNASGGLVPLDPAERQQKHIEPLASKQNAAASNYTRRFSCIGFLIATVSGPKKRFSAAVWAGDVDGVERILNNPASRRALDNHTLYIELKYAISQELQYMIKPMIDATNAKAGYSSLLMIAVEREDQSTVRYLLDNGADVNYQADTEVINCNALRCAIETKSESMVCILLACGADVNAKYKTSTLYIDDCTAIHQASANGLLSIMGLLLENGADIEEACFLHGTPVMVAIHARNVQAMRYLVGKGADINKPAGFAIDSPLEWTTWIGSLEMVRILVENGAVLGLKDAYKYAQDKIGLSNRTEIMRLLDQQRSRLRNDRSRPAENLPYRRPRSEL